MMLGLNTSDICNGELQFSDYNEQNLDMSDLSSLVMWHN